jgi:Spy/CpxP family protein refolding chaperone
MKTALRTLLVGLLLGLPLLAWSAPPMQRMMGQLDLTDQQKTQVQTLCRDHQKAMIPLQDDLRSLRHQMQLLITKENASSGEIKTLAGKIGTATEKIAQEKADHMLKIRNLLTPEQRTKFDMMILNGRGLGRGMGKMQGRGMRGMQPPAPPGTPPMPQCPNPNCPRTPMPQ